MGELWDFLHTWRILWFREDWTPETMAARAAGEFRQLQAVCALPLLNKQVPSTNQQHKLMKLYCGHKFRHLWHNKGHTGLFAFVLCSHKHVWCHKSNICFQPVRNWDAGHLD